MSNTISSTYDFFITALKIRRKTVPCLLFECRHDNQLKQKCAQLGYTVYEIRHGDNNWADPATIERRVYANFWGYIALNDADAICLLEKKINKDGFFQVNNKKLNRFDCGSATHYSGRPLPVLA
jgi:hypothetical protein